MTSAATRILLIEDNEGDAFLIEEILTPNSSNSFTIDWRDNLAAGDDAMIFVRISGPSVVESVCSPSATHADASPRHAPPPTYVARLPIHCIILAA